MTPAEQKAKELIEKFEPYCTYEIGEIQQQREYAKYCAIICVEEIIGTFDKEYSFLWLDEQLNNIHQTVGTPNKISEYTEPMRNFWQQVKTYLQR